MCDRFSAKRIHSQECSKRLDEKMFEKEWLASSLCGRNCHLGSEAANTKTVTFSIHSTTWNCFPIVEKEHCGNPLSNRRWHTESQRSCGQSQGMPQRFCHSTGAVVRCNPHELGQEWIFRIDISEPTWPSERFWIYIMEVSMCCNIPQECSQRIDIQSNIWSIVMELPAAFCGEDALQ